MLKSKNSITLKLFRRYKSFDTKKRDNFVITDLFLFVINSTIGNLFD